jgi:hypothetical protein
MHPWMAVPKYMPPAVCGQQAGAAVRHMICVSTHIRQLKGGLSLKLALPAGMGPASRPGQRCRSCIGAASDRWMLPWTLPTSFCIAMDGAHLPGWLVECWSGSVIYLVVFPCLMLILLQPGLAPKNTVPQCCFDR